MKSPARILFFVIFWALGIVCYKVFWAAILLLALIAVIFWKFRLVKIISIFILAFLLGFLRMYIAHDKGIDYSEAAQNKKITVEGFICEDLDRRDDFMFLYVQAEKAQVAGVAQAADFKFIIKTDLYADFEYGDYVKAQGFLVAAADYFQAKDIKYFMYYPKISASGSQKQNIFMKFIIFVRRSVLGAIENVFSEPVASFIAGLLIGSRKSIPDEIMQNFNKIGLTHVLAISGWNITLIISFAAAIFGFLGRRLKIIFSLVTICIFVLIVGGNPSVLRAGIMGAVSLIALAFGRQGIPLITLCVSGFLMTLVNPKILLFDVGFQFSFLSTLSLICLLPRFVEFFKCIPAAFGLRDIFLATMSSQIFILPIAVAAFGRISIVSPIANIFILPFIPFIMFFSFFAISLGAIFLPAGALLAVLPIMLSKFIFWISALMASFDFAYIDVFQIPTSARLLYFTFILYVLIKIEVFEA
ncbi:ComEC/Rec2 family competence protein [Candidatus Peregrinibacteria bacterium]|nr:ComEC/Rec2 family competence protein [Candidatus Peregrinibacteria bacterium]